MILEVDHTRCRAPRKHENPTRRRAQSLQKAFGPGSGSYLRSRCYVRQRTPRKHENAGRRGRRTDGHDGPAYMQISCRLSSPQRGQVVGSTICSAVQGAIFEVVPMVCRPPRRTRMQREEGPKARSQALRPGEQIVEGYFRNRPRVFSRAPCSTKTQREEQSVQDVCGPQSPTPTQAP